MAKKDKKSSIQSLPQYPPVVVVLGHVDHGKTSLLDAIRKSNIAEREHGGITQKIGASKIEVEHEGTKRPITFIDTPGHEAFSAMRSRGTEVAEIGLLVVAATEGIKPQTKEAIAVLQKSGIPFIAVLTKSDLPTKNSEKVKQELSREKVLLEEYGGDVPVIEVSAKTNSNIKELLELILLVYDLKSSKTSHAPSNPFKGIVIESKLDRRVGPLVTIVVKNGTVKVKDELVGGGTVGRVRNLIDDSAKQLQEATIGQAVEVLGFEKVPKVGSIISRKGEEFQVSTETALEKAPPHALSTEQVLPPAVEPVNQMMFYQAETTPNALSLLICSDTEGSLEAILNMIPKDITLISTKTGDVSEADVFLAKAAKAIIVGFNIKLRPEVLSLARQEKVLVKNYQIIYELVDEITDVLEGKKTMLEERILGVAKVLASFPFEKTKVLGISVADGRVAKGDKVRIERGETVVGESTITSVRQGKESISKIEKGREGGIILTPVLDFTIGDMVICHG